jgi:hypothetical protein
MKRIVTILGIIFIFNCAASQVLSPKRKIDDQQVLAIIKEFDNSGQKSFHVEVEKMIERYRWNDWVAFKALEKASLDIFPSEDDNYRYTFCWYILQKLNIDVKIVYQNNKLLLCAYTKDSLKTHLPIIANGKRYFCLNNYGSDFNARNFVLSSLTNSSKGRPFEFIFTTPPAFPDVDTVGIISGIFYDSVINNKIEPFTLYSYKFYQEILRSYPELSERYAFDAPLTGVISKSLIAQIKSVVGSANQIDKTKFLFLLLRDGYFDPVDSLPYAHIGTNIPEYEFFSTFHDSKSKSEMFYALAKELIEPSVIVLYYPDLNHYNVGISLDKFGVKGEFLYKNRSYGICDLSVKYDPKNQTYLRESFGNNFLFKKYKFQIVVER